MSTSSATSAEVTRRPKSAPGKIAPAFTLIVARHRYPTKQIIESDQHADVPPLEQARTYQALMDEMGWTPAELGSRIGKAAHRITERTGLRRSASCSWTGAGPVALGPCN
ncbi:MAG TPA: hypothetical protein VJY33_07055 [Isosphaeraceae bacterium]|nr:hypothetical protein [Isosphaeraceae bacterium]